MCDPTIMWQLDEKWQSRHDSIAGLCYNEISAYNIIIIPKKNIIKLFVNGDICDIIIMLFNMSSQLDINR